MRFARLAALALATLLPACDDSLGPVDVDGRFPRVEGLWDIDAFVQSSSCGFVDSEFFVARVFQERDFLEIVVDVAGAGDIRYEGFIDRDGEFLVSHRTVFRDQEIRDEAEVEGEFGFSGRSLVATEREIISDLLTGRRCTIVWRWRGDRR